MSKAKSQRHSRRRGQRRSRRLANRGGAWYNPLSWFQKEEEPSYMSNLGMGMQPEEKPLLESVGEGAKNLMQTADQKIVEASNAISSGVSSASQSVQDVLKTDIPITGSSEQPAPSYSQPVAPASSFGGRRRARSRGRSQKQRGGKGGLGLTYYASPVDGMKVAEPTYWEEYKGGRRRSRTQRKTRGRARGRGKTRSKSQRRH